MTLKINDQIIHPVKGIGTILNIQRPVHDRFGGKLPGYQMLIEYKDWPYAEGKKELLYSGDLDKVGIVES